MFDKQICWLPGNKNEIVEKSTYENAYCVDAIHIHKNALLTTQIPNQIKIIED